MLPSPLQGFMHSLCERIRLNFEFNSISTHETYAPLAGDGYELFQLESTVRRARELQRE